MADGSHTSEEHVSFGQRLPPLYIYLKRVLDKYPEGGQILKELVQNADDAKASKVVFLYDKTEHPRQKLWSPTLAGFQGPALYAYNDAAFTKEDWKNIQNPEQSGKRKDPTKVGRFGLGFISVFHLTDMPCILSENHIGYLDPLEENFVFDPHTNIRNVGERGKSWKLSPALLRDYPDQFLPFLTELFSCSEGNFEKGSFKGTIFRFPLRKSPSELSGSVFNDEHRVMELFESFQNDAELSLLFLKNIESIAAYERCGREGEPKLIYKVQIDQEDRPQVRENMENFLSKVPERQDFHTVSSLQIESQLGPEAEVSMSRFILINVLKNNNTTDELSALINDEELKFLPWMGMSFRISCNVEHGMNEQNGRVFCFLPLPDSETTGLPVHVHGYFGLGDNRRSIKWPDQESKHDKQAHWNHLLVTEVLPEVYARLILTAITISRNQMDAILPEDVYKGWPCINNVNKAWSDGVKKFLRLLKDEAIFYTDQGCWNKSDDVYINTTNDEMISKVLIQKRRSVARLPKHVLEALDWAEVPYRSLTPQVVRSCIRGDPLQFLNREEKLNLLQYITSDSISDLNDIHLLPLANRTFTSFGKNLPTVYIDSIDNPSTLIPYGEGRFAACDLPDVLNDSQAEIYTQLKILGITDVVPLLREMLPNAWSSGSTSGTLQWSPGINQHPSEEWLRIMWQWLTKNHMEVRLSAFENIPLIPMLVTSRMARLKGNGLIFAKHQTATDPGGLSENVCSFLETAGIVVIRQALPDYVAKHPDLKGFIRAPTPEGVMGVLDTLNRIHGTQHICSGVQNMPSDAKDELRGLLAQPHWKMKPLQQDILRQLPLFVASSGSYISAGSCIALVPAEMFGIPVDVLEDGAKYILQRDISDNLALSLQVPVMTVRELLSKSILPAVAAGFYSSDKSLNIMTWVLEKPEFDDLIRDIQFIPRTSQQLSCPNDLFEPSNVLQVLLKNQDVFPTGAYAEGKLLKFLKRVGLKDQSNITAMDVLEAAVQLTETQDMGQADVERGQVLLDHIINHPHVLNDIVTSGTTKEPLFKVLGNLFWVPCEASPPPDYPMTAGWIGKSTSLYSPKAVGLIQSALFFGSVLPLVDKPSLGEEVLHAFSWKPNPDPNNQQHVVYVVCHLKNIADTSQSSQESYIVSKSASVIYKFLSEASNQDLSAVFKTHMNESQPWVWHGSGFTTPDKIALSVGNLGVSLVPYLHILPKDMHRFCVFFSEIGVNPTFQEKELSIVLVSVQNKHQSQQVPSKEDYQTDLNLVCNILRYIADLNFDTQSTKILVPCRSVVGESRLKMVPASKCLYVDEERLVDQLSDENTKEEFGESVIHESVSNDLARRLGLLPLSHFLAPVDEVEIEYEMAGPHETTVDAIKRNLDMYKNNVDIFKELIQNADDAGATEVKFLLDWRRNEQTSCNLLSDKMKECHGPALWAYNDACFSKDDIKNICSIAAQSKKHQLDKVGRFGLGFTSVYHLTDVPSVVSGPYVLICDPRTIYLGSRVKAGQPGIKLDLTNERHRRTLKSYPDQFQPYNGIFGCHLQASTTYYDHTLFRLPLRTMFGADSQQPNQLSDFVCDSRDKLHPLIESLKETAETLLLFTQNIAHISLHELSENESVMKDVMSVTVSRLQQMPRSISCAAENADGMKTQRNLLKATTECIGDPTLPVPETTMLLKITQKIHGTCENTEDLHYITSSCMSRGIISELAKTPEGLKAAVLPCGGIAFKIIEDEEGNLTLKPVKGSAFSFLPINVLTGLPFHVNGSFLLQPNRRQLWGKSSSGTDEFEVRWNCCFIESVLCNALLNLLQDLQGLQEKGIDAPNFQSLWPKRVVCDSNFHPLVDAFYQRIGTENNAPAVIFDDGRWLTVHDCFFTHWEACDPKSLRYSITSLLEKNQDPKRWVELEADVISSISAAGANRCFDDNTFSVKRFLTEIFFPAFRNSRHIESDHHKEITLHVLDLRLGGGKVTTYDEELRTTKCIPTSPNGDELLRPDQLVNPCSSIGSLYSEEDCRFPHGSEFREEARLLSLTQLGMATDDLSWEDICERAESMLNDGQCEKRCTVLLKLICKKIINSDQPSSDQKQQIQQADFLPVLKIPDGYPAKWYTCEDGLMSAATLYACSHKDLLGSVRPLLDEDRLGFETIGPQIKDFLGIHKKKVTVTDVVQQLTEVIDEASAVNQHTNPMLHKIYSFLQTEVVSESYHMSVKEEHRVAFNNLCTLRFVLCEQAFRECQQLAFDYSGPSGPYLFRVPPWLIQFKNLLKLCGIRDKFEVKDYLQTLQKLKTTYKDTPLAQSDLKTAKAMVREVVSKSTIDPDGTRNVLNDAKIYIPDNSNVLRPPQELTFNDVDWEGSWGSNVYTHPDMSYNDAKVFDIVTQREKQLETCSSSGGFEMDFGQREELTDRLSGILRSYPNVSDVFKEMLQNADDAGASEIHFVYDPRSHPFKKITSDSWAAVQQLPSLCIYDDKPFTEKDIKGIQKVGVGGKRDDIATTGKFGIGFNAVYHLTDCPSFMTNRDSLCVFDPLLKYVRGTRKSSPGKKFSTTDKFRELYPDMLSGYLEDMDEFCGKKGTMFRLPLRARASVISDKVYSPSDMHSLLNDFQKVSQDALLFLNNINKITISRIEEQTGKLQQVYSINAKLTAKDERSRMKLVEHLMLFNEHPCQEIDPMSCVYSLVTKDSSGSSKTWLISQMLGVKGLGVNSQMLSNAAQLKKPLPRGGIAALMKDSIHEDMDARKYTAYCFLPLPIYTALPVHVNGTFELDAARKNLEKGCAYSEDGLVHPWNKLLVEKVIAPAYAELITRAGRRILEESKAKKSHKEQLKLYDNIFPKNPDVLRGEWRLLAEATLRYIGGNNLEVLPVVKPTSGKISWHHPNSDTSRAFFDGFDEKEDIRSVGVEAFKPQTNATLLRPFLLKVGFYLLSSSPELCRAFQACGVKAEFVSPPAVVQHLSSESVITPQLPAPLTKTAFKDLKTFRAVFEYCLDSLTTPTDLHGLPLQLANDETLGQFTTEDRLYATSHWKILPSLGNMFLHRDLVKLCTTWFEMNSIFTSGVFIKFTIAELGKYLGEQLPESWEGCGQHVEWKPQKKDHPSETWLKDLWRFICSQMSDEKPLQAIENWPIFPTTAGNLVPPTKSKTVMSLHTIDRIGFGQELATVLRKLGLPENAWKKMYLSNTTYPPIDLTPILDEYLALPNSHEDIIGVIQYIIVTSALLGALELKDCTILLKYFQEGFGDNKTLTQQNIKIIRSLPIFQLLGETKCTDIQRPLHYHTVETKYDVFREEPNIWMGNRNCVFLEAIPRLSLLHKELGISAVTLAEVYLKYILPSFHLLTQKAIIKHIENIRDKVLQRATREDEEAILDHLSRVEFIYDQFDKLRPASYFYDPGNTVFKAMVDPAMLLPEQPELTRPLMRDFLSRIGLHTDVTPQNFIKFAQKVEERARVNTDTNQLKVLCDNSRLLKNELDYNDSLHDQKTLRDISTIKFIPSTSIKSELLTVCPPYSSSGIPTSGGVPFIAYRGSVPSMYTELVWSASSVLPHWAETVAGNKQIGTSQTNRAQTVHECLGIITDASAVMEKVLTHTKLVCQRMEKKNAIHKEDKLSQKVRETVAGVMNKILLHLKENISKHKETIRRCLLNTPICPLEGCTVFVKADQVVFDLGDIKDGALKPYLYEIPRDLMWFEGIFKLLGAQETCSFDQLAGVLATLANHCENESNKLNPNQQKSAQCAVKSIFKLLKDQKGGCQISAAKLYLPTVGYTMKEARQLYYADPDQMQQLDTASSGGRKFILPLRVCGFRCKNEVALFSYLPDRLRPKFLKDELQEKPCDTNKDCNEGQDCRYLAHIKQMLISEEMTEVLLRLYQHQLKEIEMPEEIMKRIEVLQNFNKLSCQVKLKLGFYDNEGRKVTNQQFPRKAFLDKNTSTLYLEHVWPLGKHMSQTFQEVAECCNELLDGLLNDKNVAVLHSALDSPSPIDMNDVLSSRKIPYYTEEGMGFQTQRHKPGTIMPRDVRTQLNDDPYNRFEKDEIVGYRRTIDELPAEDSVATRSKRRRVSSVASLTGKATEVIYAIIVGQVGSDDKDSSLSRRYEIDVGLKEHIIVSVTTLYKFLSLKDEDDDGLSDNTLPADPQSDREQIQREVREAMALPKEEQRRVIHRLYRKWHPDKNPGQEKRTTEAFQFLTQEIDRCDAENQYKQAYNCWESEVRRDRDEARRYQQMHNQSRRRRNKSNWSNVPTSFSRETPDPRSARLWFRQAKEHFTAAEKTSQLGPSQVQWVAFQLHQAAELALKAAQYNLTGRPDIHSNSLTSLASTVCRHRYVTSNELTSLASGLERHECLYDKPRYPVSSQTSEQAYQSFSVEDATRHCKSLLSLVQEIIGIQEF